MLLNRFRAKISTEPVLGIFCKTTDSSFIEAAGFAGLDFLIIDMEHGPVTFDLLQNHVRAAVCGGVVPIVRVKELDAHSIGAALDSGALAVQVPNISCAAEAAAVVNAAKFYPLGMRGVCRFVRAAKYGHVKADEYFSGANNTLVILQVEGVDGIKNIDEILNVPGVDVIFIGPYDLSQSLGIPGQVESQKVTDLMRDISKRAEEKGICLGTFSDSPARSRALIREGFKYVACSVDVNIFHSAITRMINEV